MSASISFFDKFRFRAMDGTFDMDLNTFKLSAHTSTYVPSVANDEVFASCTNELSTANGYTAGGVTLSGVTWTRSTVTCKFVSTNPAWTASGGNIGPFRNLVLRASGTLNSLVDPIVAYILLDTTPADTTVLNGNTLTVAWNASGIFTLS